MTGCPATVDVQNFPSYVRCRLEIQVAVHNVTNLANVAKRRQSAGKGFRCVGLRRMQRSLDDSWRDRVDTDAARCEFDCQ